MVCVYAIEFAFCSTGGIATHVVVVLILCSLL